MDHSLQYVLSGPSRRPPTQPTSKPATFARLPGATPETPTPHRNNPSSSPAAALPARYALSNRSRRTPGALSATPPFASSGMKAPRNQNQSTGNRNHNYLQQLELRAGIAKWPIPSIETRSPPDSRDGITYKQAEQQMKHYDLRDKLGVLNSRHGTHLSMLELEICVSLVDYRLGSTTSTNDVLDEFLSSPLLFDAPRWKRSANDNPYMAAKSKMPSSQRDDDDDEIEFNDLVPGADADDVRAVLKMINMRAGTSFLLTELAVVVSLMNHLHGRAIGLLDVLGLRDGGQQSGLSESQVVVLS